MHIIILGFFLLILLIYFDVFYSPIIIRAENVVLNTLLLLRIKSLVIQEAHQGLWATRGYDVYLSVDNGKTFEKKFRIPVSVKSLYFIGNSSLFRKLFHRNEWLELKILNTGTIIAFADGKIFRLGHNEEQFAIVHNLRYFGKNVGKGVFPAGIAEDKNGNVYYGEYYKNTNREDVKIYVSKDDGQKWNKFFTFDSKEIRHIHGLGFDRYSNALWVSTGDAKSEVLIGYFPNNEPQLKLVTRGVQDLCAISFLFSESCVYWGADTPYLDSFIYKYNRKDKSIVKQQALNGPAWYAVMVNKNFMAISTTVEKIIKGAVTDGNAAIWVSDNGDKWNKMFTFEKDKNSKFFTSIRFPRGYNIDDLIFTVLNAKQYGSDTFIFSLDSCISR